MIRGIRFSLLFMGVLAAFVWYGVTGETGPMGWLDHWQQAASGSSSRGLSFLLLCLAVGLLAAPVVVIWRTLALQVDAWKRRRGAASRAE
jgi:hypothetical protein